MEKKLSALVIITFIMFYSCSPKQSEIIVTEFDSTKVYFDEFKSEYEKSAGIGAKLTIDSLSNAKKFLDLYGLYRIKLAECTANKYDKDSAIAQEYANTKYSMGRDYIDNKLIEMKGLKNFYSKRLKEYKVTDLLIMEDSTRTLTVIEELSKKIIDSLKNGSNWDEMFIKYCNNPDLKTMKGNFGYITAGNLVKVLENAVYNTKIGDVYEKPVMLGRGIHIIRVTDIRDRVDQIRVQHILISPKDTVNVKTEETALKLATDLYDRVNKGEIFDSLASKFSFDKGSAEKGGDIGFISRGATVPEFDEAAFNLKINEISKPVKTQFGYHIIKLNEIKKIASFDKEIENIKPLYKKHFFNNEKQLFLDSLKKHYNLVLFKKNIDSTKKLLTDISFLKARDSSDVLKNIKDVELFTINSQKFYIKDWAHFLDTTNATRSTIFSKGSFEYTVDVFIQKEIYKIAVNELFQRDKEFKDIIVAYKNGAMLFKLQENEIWNKVVVSDKEKQTYFEENKDKFNWNDRVSYYEITSYAKERLDTLISLYNSGKNLNELNSFFITKDGKRGLVKKVFEKVNVKLDFISEKANNIADNKISESFVGKYDLWTAIIPFEKFPAGPKTYDEAESEIFSIIQDKKQKERDQQFNEELKKKYNLKIYYENLEKALQ